MIAKINVKPITKYTAFALRRTSVGSFGRKQTAFCAKNHNKPVIIWWEKCCVLVFKYAEYFVTTAL
jgi:hypothetical protein